MFINCGVAFEYFSRTFLDAVKGIGIFARDVSVIFLSVFVLDILLYCLLRKLSLIHNAVKFMLLAISAGVFIVDVFTVYYFKAPVNTTIIDVIIRTNFREGTEFMQTYLASPEIWLLFIFVAAALVLMRYLFAVICRKKVLFLLLLIIGASAGLASEIRDLRRHVGLRYMKSIAASRLSWMMYKWHNDNLAWQNMLKTLSDIKLIKNDGNIPYIVFILGESTNRNHMGIYGYNLPTTPNLSGLQKDGRLYVFDDVISSRGLTMQAFSEY